MQKLEVRRQEHGHITTFSAHRATQIFGQVVLKFFCAIDIRWWCAPGTIRLYPGPERVRPRLDRAGLSGKVHEAGGGLQRVGGQRLEAVRALTEEDVEVCSFSRRADVAVASEGSRHEF